MFHYRQALWCSSGINPFQLKEKGKFKGAITLSFCMHPLKSNILNSNSFFSK